MPGAPSPARGGGRIRVGSDEWGQDGLNGGRSRCGRVGAHATLIWGHGGARVLILASSSPRRRALLEQLRLRFVVRSPDFDETTVAATSAEGLVRGLASAKAAAVDCGPGDVVIAADTVVALDGEVLGKPGGSGQAAEMLRRLSGREHRVWTGLAVRDALRERIVAECTRVWIRDLDDASIRAYVASGEPLDKAGAYGVQGLGAALVRRVDGCHYNVVGLPLARLVDLLDEFGVRVLS